ncbi:MAG: chorismate mutase [Alphaproteobacteria bacterium]
MSYKNMEELRKELDLLDNELIKLVSKRFKFIEQAAIIKDDISKIRDNDRIEDIIKRLRKLSKNNDISPDIVEKLWRYIIELSIELETEIFSKK